MTKDAQRSDGHFTVYRKDERVWVALLPAQLGEAFLFSVDVAQGLGERGLYGNQMGRSYVAYFRRSGERIQLVARNEEFFAAAGTPQSRFVGESFAESLIASAPVASLPHPETKALLIDAGALLIADIPGYLTRLEAAFRMPFALDRNNSAIVKLTNQAQQSVFEVRAHYAVPKLPAPPLKPAAEAAPAPPRALPDPRSAFLGFRYSFARLPAEPMRPRVADERIGHFTVAREDFSEDTSAKRRRHFVQRWRLDKRDPAAAVSATREPLVFWLDRNIPEKYRRAVAGGVLEWNKAFERIGLKDAIAVRQQEGADDIEQGPARRAVVRWFTGADVGFAIGPRRADPRTGEILKGHVSLGSLRIRQDFMIAQGLLSPFRGAHPDVEKAREMALARIRQLSAHEVGHTLGLAHNYASSVNNRASVMDYPHPLINLTDAGEIDLSKAYDTGIGEWDKMAIRYGYSDFPSLTDEKQALEMIIRESIDRSLYFISDRDARPMGSAHPYAHLWDNQLNAADELNRMIEIRKIVIHNFGINSIPEGTPLSSLEDVFVTVYLLHRYQLEAACKVVGGLYYTYALKGDGQIITELISPEKQTMALKAVLRTLQPEFLKIPENILQLFPPKALDYYDTREDFKSKTGLTFDPLSAAESTADLSLTLLLHPERTARLVEHHARDRHQPDLLGVLDDVVENTWHQSYSDPYDAEINRAVSKLVLEHLFNLCENENSTRQVKAIALAQIIELDQWLGRKTETRNMEERAHYLYAIEMIRRFRERPELFKTPEIQELPLGPPIGTDPSGCDF